MDALLKDIRYATRQLLRSPTFTTIVVATLALGIGANTTLFTLTSGLLLRPLPGVGESNRLVWLAATRGAGDRMTPMSYADFAALRHAAGTLLSGAAAIADVDVSISRNGEPERVRGELVSGDYFSLVRTPMAAGRGFTAAEDSAALVRPVAVISHSLWERRYEKDASAIGSSLIVNGRAFTIVGVTAEGFNGVDLEIRRDVWLPFSTAPLAMPSAPNVLRDPAAWLLIAIGRLAPGANRAQLDAVLATTARRLAAEDTIEHREFGARTFSARSGMPPNSLREIAPLAIIAVGTTGLVLLIACANVSNLLLGRSVARRREIAIRLSLGAGRARIVRQLLTESVILAALASVCGLVVALWGADLLVSIGATPLSIDLSVDRPMLLFSVALAAFTGVLFGLAPALNATRPGMRSALDDAMPGGDARRIRLQSGFVIAQVSLSFVLLIAAAIFVRGLTNAAAVDVGFDARGNVLAMSFDLGMQAYDDEHATSFVDQLGQQASAIPGVDRVSFADQVPLSERHAGADVTSETDLAHGGEPRRSRHEVFRTAVRPNYFATIGLTLVLGRDFTESDRVGSMPVVIVGDDLAATLWPGANPIGQRLLLDGHARPLYTVIGVAKRSFSAGIDENRRSTIYLAQRQMPSAKGLTLLVRTRGDAAALTRPIRELARTLDRDLPVFHVQTMAQYRDDSLQKYQLGSRLIGLFGLLALMLASIGVYAVMTFSVSQRTREIGVRMALGAPRHDVVMLFVKRGVRLATIGVCIGIVLSIGVSRLLASLLVVVSSTDVVPFAAVVLLLGGTAILANWIPARRAARVDPMTALRHE